MSLSRVRHKDRVVSLDMTISTVLITPSTLEEIRERVSGWSRAECTRHLHTTTSRDRDGVGGVEEVESRVLNCSDSSFLT